LLAVGGTNDLVTLCSQQSGEQFTVCFVVIGHKDVSLVPVLSGHHASLANVSFRAFAYNVG
jgi:hypothetical protein